MAYSKISFNKNLNHRNQSNDLQRKSINWFFFAKANLKLFLNLPASHIKAPAISNFTCSDFLSVKGLRQVLQTTT